MNISLALIEPLVKLTYNATAAAESHKQAQGKNFWQQISVKFCMGIYT